jgi:carbamoyltransferase
MTESATFIVDDADISGVRGVLSKLAGVGYSESSITERLDLEDLADLQWRFAPIYRSEHLVSRDSLALAIDLFLLQGFLPSNELDRLFAQSEQDVLIRAGLLAIDEAGLARARASLFPVGARLIFSDHAWPELPHPGYATVPCDQVMAVGLDSRLLARCTPSRQFGNALDLCTGSGIQALLASNHSGRVLAVDVSPRAARCTRFNAQVSGTTNLEVVVGDLFEAAQGKRFDLITANPPFVPSPLDTLRFRDGGRSGEDVLKRVVAGLPHYLAPGGLAQIVTELGERDHEPLVDRLRQWLNGAPMDIHILRLGEHAAMKYSIGHAKGDDYQTFLDSTNEWASNLRAQGYIRVVTLVISLQWSDATLGPTWECVIESPPPRRAAGAEIDAAFLAERWTRQLDSQQALKRSWLREY